MLSSFLIAVLLSVPSDPRILSVPIAEAAVYDLTSTTTVASYVRQVEERDGLELFYETAECESRFENVQSRIIQKDGTREPSYGIFQIHLPSHAVTKTQALDPRFNIEWAAKEFKAGREWQWTCHRLISKQRQI